MTTKNLVYTALMTAIIAVLGLVPPIPLPGIPVPIVLQNMGVFLAGILLGRKYGALSVIVFLLLVVAGAQILPGARGGIGVFASPSAGFLIMYPVVAYGVGLLRDKWLHKVTAWRLFIAVFLVGVVLLDLVGSIIMGMIMNVDIKTSLKGMFLFYPGDIIKAIIASLIGASMLRHSKFKQLLNLK